MGGTDRGAPRRAGAGQGVVARGRASVTGESQRQLRVGEQMRHVLAELLGRGAAHHPALAEASLTVSEVRLSRDLRRAVVFVTELGGRLRPETRAALAHAGAYLRGEVARRMHLKYAPELVFEPDTSFEQAGRIDALLAAERAALAERAAGKDDDGADPA